MNVQTIRMGTASGQDIFYLEPERYQVNLRDIFVHTRNAGRYAGAINVSVLFHSALVVRLATFRDYLPLPLAYVAAHDLHEAIVGEVTSPLKQVLPEFVERIETPWERHFHLSFGLEYPVPEDIHRQVKLVDYRALVLESQMKEHPLADDIAERHGGPATAQEIDTFRYLEEATVYEQWHDVACTLRYGGSPLFKDWR